MFVSSLIKPSSTACAAVFMACVAGNSASASILFDFNEVAPAPTIGGTWNTLAAPTSGGGYFNADGSPSAITLTFAGLWSDSTTVQDTGWNGGSSKDWVDNAAARDYFWRGEIMTLMIGGLDPNTLYGIEIVAARETTGSRIGTYTINGEATNVDVSSTGFDAQADGWNNASILRWTDVQPDTNGDVVLSMVPDSGSTVWLNAMQVTPVPEPASLGLLATGGLLMISRRRR